VADNIAGRTICAFGEACAWPVQSFVAKFPEEFAQRARREEKNKAGGPPARELEAV
jgi:NADH-quinone oxidoreductase subunit F